MKDNLKQVQKILLNELERLNDDDIMDYNYKKEVTRATAISQNASSFVNAANLKLKALEFSQKYNADVNEIKREIGLVDNETK